MSNPILEAFHEIVLHNRELYTDGGMRYLLISKSGPVAAVNWFDGPGDHIDNRDNPGYIVFDDQTEHIRHESHSEVSIRYEDLIGFVDIAD